jgi:Ca-activated chloride channel family protein
VTDAYPYPLPDLFAGTQLVVVGRYRNSGETTVTLEGQVNGNPQTFQYNSVRFSSAGGDEFIARLWATRKIGYLLQQIRLNGEDSELVNEIVDLSIRYGIITPYTSFLVEETDRALSEAGREGIAREVQSTAAPADVSGGAAVERSVGEKALSGAEAPAAPALLPGMENSATDPYGNQINPVRYVGDRTFVLNDGVWTDTTFDADAMDPVAVGFGSDDYFALLEAHPEWGRYLALGDHVIVVLDGTAYEVREGDAPPLAVPTAEPTPVPTSGQASASTAVATPQPAPGSSPTVLEAIVRAIQELFARIAESLSD